jgi:hypothetical protein
MNGECSLSLDAWEGWEHNGWGVLPIIEMLKEVEIQWMKSTPHHANHISAKSCLADGERSLLPLPMSTKKTAL